MILIAAHPRSGQNYISRVLSTTNKKIGIGYTSKDGRSFYEDDIPIVDGVVNFACIRQAPLLDTILHQVRDPLKCISSSTTEEAGTYNLIFRTLQAYPILKTGKGEIQLVADNPILPLWSWVNLNKAIEKVADWRYRIEDIDSVFPELCQRLGIENNGLPDIPRNFNTRPHIEYTWNDLETIDSELCKQAKELGEKYGY